MEENGNVLGGAVVRAGDVLIAVLFFLICFFNQRRNKVKANVKDQKHQKKRFYCCKHIM